MSFIDLDSKSIYYEEYGKHNTHTIVYFHGGPGESCLSFTHQAKILGEKYHVISFDQYGVLRSDAISDNEVFGVEEHAVIIDKMREKLGINAWSILGHSYGGMLACLYAYKYPKNIVSMIYDCPTWNILLTAKAVAKLLLPYFKKVNSMNELTTCLEILDEHIPSKEAFNKVIQLSGMMQTNEDIQKYSHVIDPNVYREYILKYIPQLNIDANSQQKFIKHTQKLLDKGDFYSDYLPLLKEISAPSLLMIGKYDVTCGRDQKDYFKQFAQNGYVYEFQHSAHLPWMQEPELYSKTIVDFLETTI